ncbi:MAG: DUF962 domain-containing protein [Aureispira sp.]|nr:DUF962 domain-containing protein [Aureispira sp.]
MEKKYKTLKEFYPYYLTEHLDPICGGLHFVGTATLLAVLVYAIVSQTWWMLGLLPVIGYGFAWVGHFVFEKNRPATFTYPGFSLASDFIMFYHILTFQISKKLENARQIIGK